MSVNNAGYAAEVNEAGEVIVRYDGDDLSVKNLKIGSLGFKLGLEGINTPVEASASKLEAANTSPKVKVSGLNGKSGRLIFIVSYRGGFSRKLTVKVKRSK